MTLEILVKAALDGTSIEAVCQELCAVADSNTLREQLNKALDIVDLRDHEAQMNAALASLIPKDVPRQGVQLALDWHDEAFYGKTPLLRTYTCSGSAKAGTTHFFRVASLYLIWQDVRLTIALTYVLPEDSLVQVVERLRQNLVRHAFSKTIWYLDKGFCSGEILRYLQTHNQKAILACPIRGKKHGTRALCRGRKSYVTTYTFTDGTTVQAVVVATLVRDGTGKKRRKWLLFVMLGLNWSPSQVYQRYRRRFGIECAYRILRQCRVTTNSRNPMVRFFLLGLALLLPNIWVALRWRVARVLGPGPRRVDPRHFRFHLFKFMLRRVIEFFYAPVTIISASLDPTFVIH
jgi:putative transposase